MTHPFMLATYASFDRSGRVVVYAAALQTIGMAVGPAIGASLITEGHYSPVNYLAVVLFALCLLLILPATLMQARSARAAAAAATAAGS
jgi:MFS family permease